MSRTAVTSVPISPVLAERWSPRAYDSARAVPAELITAALEAARWAPSANNSQPWRFIVGTRGTEAFDKIRAGLLSFNQAWTERAGALVANIVDTQLGEGHSATWLDYDLGQAVAFLVAQANRDGLHARQMGGVDGEAILNAFGLDTSRYRVMTVVALGYLGDAEELPEPLRERELAPRQRKALDEIVIVRD
ncbi:MAG: nitroreductase family protein [Agromyces sp.]